MRRFFIHPDTEISAEVLLSEEESHHIARVLRLSAGDLLQLFDGRGNVHDAEITGIGRQVCLRICSSQYVEETGVPLRVCQGILKGKKIEFLLQKCTELGVAEFVPFISSRCQLKKTEQKKLAGKYDRWQKIIDEACKQCNRVRPMQLAKVWSFQELVEQELDTGQGILFWEEEKKRSIHTASLPSSETGLQIVLGPEGGFSADEAGSAEKAGFQILSLGSQILRAETANIAAVSIMQYVLGNMQPDQSD